MPLRGGALLTVGLYLHHRHFPFPRPVLTLLAKISRFSLSDPPHTLGMAQDRRPEIEPEEVSSGEDEEDEEVSTAEGSESESESEEEQEKLTPAAPAVTKKPSSSKSFKVAPPSPESSDGDSDSDSDPPPGESGKPDPNIKPIASKPMDDPPKKPRSRPAAPAKRDAGNKRPATEIGSKDTKRTKMKKPDAENPSNEKKQLFQRLWSEDDEIGVLKGMADYVANNGTDSVTDISAFHEFMKKSLNVEVSKAQFAAKVRRLKKKYQNNYKREEEGAKRRNFLKSHERKCYDLSKKVWGNNGGASGGGGGEIKSTAIDSPKANGTARKRQRKTNSAARHKVVEETITKEVMEKEVPLKPDDFGKALSGTTSAEEILKVGKELLESSEREELEKKWKNLNKEQVVIYLKRLELMQLQAKKILDKME